MGSLVLYNMSDSSDSDLVQRQRKKLRVSRDREREPVSSSEEESAHVMLNRLMEEKLEKKIKKVLDDTRTAYLSGTCAQSTSHQGMSSKNSMVDQDIIPLYDPADSNINICSWLNKIDQLGEIHSWSEYTRSCYMQNRLRGRARRWHNGLTNYNLSWTEWKEVLINAFPRKVDYAIKLEELVARKKTSKESMTDYYHAKLELIQTCRLDDEAAMSCIIRGLPEELQANARAYQCSTPSSLYSGFLAALDDYKTVAQFNKSTNQNNMTRSIRNNTNKFHNHNTTQNVIRCYNCNKFGHIARECKRNVTFCNFCRHRGHATNDCRRRRQVANTNQTSSPKNVQTINLGVNKSYIKSVSINGHRLKALLDTGSQVNIITATIVSFLNIKTTPKYTYLKGFGGQRTLSRGEASFSFEIDGINMQTVAAVTSAHMGVDIILGQPVLNKPGISFIAHKTKFN